jgi:hypothetical protein
MVRQGSELTLPALPLDPARIKLVLAAIGVAIFIFADLAFGGLRTSELTIVAIAGAGVLLFAARWPERALYVLVIFVPLQVALLSVVYKYGAPASAVREMGYLKDAIVGGICLAAFQARTAHGARPRKFDALDWFAIIYVGIATAYFLIPLEIRSAFGGEPTHVRLNAWRIDCVFVILMFAARRVPFTPEQLRRARLLVMGLAAFLLIFSILESVDASTYQKLLARDLGYPAYQTNVLHAPLPPGGSYVIRTTVGGLTVVRAGSLFPDGSIALGFYTLVPLALGVQLLSYTRARLAAVASTTGAVAMLVLTETRAAILGGLLIIVMSVWLAYRLGLAARMRLATVAIAGALVVVPFSLHSNVVQRFESIWTHSDSADNQSHVDRSRSGFHSVFDHPGGKGLGANPATGLRYGTGNFNGLSAENAYLTVGIELGIAGMVAFITMCLLLLRALLRAARGPTDARPAAAAMWLAGGGLMIGGLFLQVWASLPVSMTFWGLAGASLGCASSYKRNDQPINASS